MQGIVGKETMNKTLVSCSTVLSIQREHLRVIKSRRHVEARLCWRVDDSNYKTSGWGVRASDSCSWILSNPADHAGHLIFRYLLFLVCLTVLVNEKGKASDVKP